MQLQSHEHGQVISKVLVHESDPEHSGYLKEFFYEKKLVGLKANNVLEALDLNIDLGAVFLCEDPKYRPRTLEILHTIHQRRRELPVFLRIENSLPSSVHAHLAELSTGIYKKGEVGKLEEWIQRYLFQSEYPVPFAQGIQQITLSALQSCLPGVQVTCPFPPYLVRDRLMFGELFSLIPLESQWYRGFLILQTNTAQMSALIQSGKTIQPAHDATKYNLNNLISEITNMIWGGIKNQFDIPITGTSSRRHRTEIPIVLNYQENYLSLGSLKPQLCFHFQLQEEDPQMEPISFYQKLIFNLEWVPEHFKNSVEDFSSALNQGSIELF